MGGEGRRSAPFNINLDRVAISREAVEGVITCVRDFVRDPLSTQKSFFSDSGVAMLKDVVDVLDSVIVSEELNLWSVSGDECKQQVVSGLQPCQEKVLLRRKACGDKNDRWFGAAIAGLPSASASAGCSGIIILNIAEEGHVENVDVPEPIARSLRTVKSTVIGSKRKTSASSGQMSRKKFEVVRTVTSPRKSYTDDSSFGAALDRNASGSHRKSGRDCRVHPIFNFAKKK